MAITKTDFDNANPGAAIAAIPNAAQGSVVVNLVEIKGVSFSKSKSGYGKAVTSGVLAGQVLSGGLAQLKSQYRSGNVNWNLQFNVYLDDADKDTLEKDLESQSEKSWEVTMEHFRCDPKGAVISGTFGAVFENCGLSVIGTSPLGNAASIKGGLNVVTVTLNGNLSKGSDKGTAASLAAS